MGEVRFLVKDMDAVSDEAREVLRVSGPPLEVAGPWFERLVNRASHNVRRQRAWADRRRTA